MVVGILTERRIMAEAFNRVIVDYMVIGNAVISWEIHRHFTAKGPFWFQLQGSYAAGIPGADDWFDIGDLKENVYFLVDNNRKLYGKTPVLSYRVVLIDADDNEYVSDPANIVGNYLPHDFAIASEIIRKEKLRHRTFGSVSGYLLKARRFGEACDCLDPLTQEVTDSECQECFGTGIKIGFFAPVPEVFVQIEPNTTREHRNLAGIGTEKPDVTVGRFIGIPLVVQGDAWIDGNSDERYYIHSVKETAIWKSVPLVMEVELRKAPFSDIIYTVELPENF